MSGGTTSNNYKAYIHWTNGTETKVLLKGRRPYETATTSYRESLFYSRLADDLKQYVGTPDHYLAVADISNGNALFMEQFLTGYQSLTSVYAHWYNGTLDDIGIDASEFNLLDNQKQVFYLLGRFSASHWMDTEIQN